MPETHPEIQSVLEALREGDLASAESNCKQVLQSTPQHAQAWHLFGIINAQQNELSKAAECFEKSIEFADDNASYHYNLALARRSLKDLTGAIESYRKAVALKPQFLEAQNNLGNCLLENGDVDASVEHFRSLAEQFPEESIVQFNLGNVLEDVGEVKESAVALRRAIKLDPDFATARENLGRLLSDVQLYDEALEVWNDWLHHDPENAVAKHMIASITGENAPERCDDEYVRNTFDQDFAKSYESQLERIDYRVPTLISEVIDAMDLNKASLAVLDAGCGTGLCAEILRPLANHLIGVDLSADMLQQAKRRDIYDEIIESELTAYLHDADHSFDLIVSGDTLCYFGELVQVLAAARQRLQTGGRLIFTVERADSQASSDDSATGLNQSTPTYHLQANGRYQHQESYVRQSLCEIGFTDISMNIGTLRLERGRNVEGMLFVAQRG